MKGYFFFFFFSSRRRHTRYWRDWSSDVCSSDLPAATPDRLDNNSVMVAGFYLGPSSAVKLVTSWPCMGLVSEKQHRMLKNVEVKATRRGPLPAHGIVTLDAVRVRVHLYRRVRPGSRTHDAGLRA